MVILREQPYVSTQYNTHFAKYPYELSSFQKHAIEGILENQHVLVTAHTGSGKTLPAEFAIEHWVRLGKKVIYTSPIKALSNQKFYEFSQKFPHISFGLFTGDIKTNPEADVLIMTTEILMNRLFNYASPSSSSSSSNTENEADICNTIQKTSLELQFQMDFEKELAAVIFDEVHYINDADRGQVWEKTILMLPDHVQMIMLSATMDNPKAFGEWIERHHTNKQVYICPTNFRVVPLSHYGYMAVGEHEFKQIKDKATQQQIRNHTNKPLMLRDSKGKFYVEGYREIKSIDDQLHKQKARVNRKFVLNNLTKYLRENDMLPAICFVFSRKNVESCAKELTTPLLEDDSKIPYLVDKEAKQIIRRLPNYEEYMRLPEFVQLISLLEKGIGIHHSGMIPILREIVELFISKKYIKVLFATESFAIGLDCPIKTSVFTGITKYDGSNHRFLHSHEYTQMAGRAGRRGIDTVGYVILCNNLFREQPSQLDYKTIMGGKPPILLSKFKLDYSLVLNVLKSNTETTVDTVIQFIGKSMFQDELNKEIHQAEKEKNEIEHTLAKLEETETYQSTPVDICQKYLEYEQDLTKVQPKKRKNIQKNMDELKQTYPDLEDTIRKWKHKEETKQELNEKENYVNQLTTYVHTQVMKICNILQNNGLLAITNDDTTIQTSELGTMCSHIAEVHGPIWIECMVKKWNYFEHFSTKQLVGLFSCTTEIKLEEEYNTQIPHTDDEYLKARLYEMKELYEKYDDEETKWDVRTGIRYEEAFTFSIVEEAMKWCDCENEEQCKAFIETDLTPKGISLGDFTKAILKIATIAKEFRGLFELEPCRSQTEWLHKLTEVEEKVLKYIATNQSLYV